MHERQKVGDPLRLGDLTQVCKHILSSTPLAGAGVRSAVTLSAPLSRGVQRSVVSMSYSYTYLTLSVNGSQRGRAGAQMGQSYFLTLLPSELKLNDNQLWLLEASLSWRALLTVIKAVSSFSGVLNSFCVSWL